jgi:hypothetical protein
LHAFLAHSSLADLPDIVPGGECRIEFGQQSL